MEAEGRDAKRLDAKHDSAAGFAGDAQAITISILRTQQPGTIVSFNQPMRQR
jgi:hypothetical protein